jgi:replicative DNA helicase
VNFTANIPPQDIEAEESLLSRILIDGGISVDIIDILLPSDFYRTAHQKIFSGMIKLFLKKEPIDLITVPDILKKMGSLLEVGGAAYLTMLIDSVPLAVDIEHCVKIIKEASIARQLIATANEIATSAYNPQKDITEALDDAQAKIINIKLDMGNDNFIPVSEIVTQRVEFHEERSNNDFLIGIETGFYQFDAITGGLSGAMFIVIAARPRMGKSALMMNMASFMAAAGHKVGIFSIEMQKEVLVDRLLASESKINSLRLTTGKKFTQEEWRKINKAAASIYDYNITIDDTGGIKIQELKRRVRKLVTQGIEIIFIDQLSKIRGGKGLGEYEQRSYIVNEIANLSKNVKIPIFLLAQIGRKVEERQNKKPTLSDLKSTSSLEEDADIVLLGYREYEYTKNEADLHHAEWEIAKIKDGAECNIRMHWEGKTTTFSSIQYSNKP